MRPHLPKHSSREEDRQPGLPEKAAHGPPVPDPHKIPRRFFRPRVSQGQAGSASGHHAPGLAASLQTCTSERRLGLERPHRRRQTV